MVTAVAVDGHRSLIKSSGYCQRDSIFFWIDKRPSTHAGQFATGVLKYRNPPEGVSIPPKSIATATLQRVEEHVNPVKASDSLMVDEIMMASREEERLGNETLAELGRQCLCPRIETPLDEGL